MTSIAEDLRDHMVAALGFTDATTFVGVLPDTPDVVVSVHAGPGFGPVLVMGATVATRVAVRQATVQVIARGGKNDYEAAQDAAETVYAALAALGGFTVNSNTYLKVQASSDALNLGPDDQGRPRVAVNFEVWKQGI